MRWPGILLGLGLGGFVDGIVLHQILQWHNMVSSVEPPDSLSALQLNVTADGLFHAATWVLVVSGLMALWNVVRSGRPWTWRTLLGWTLFGWGVFNLVEGLLDHHILQVHRVRPDAANPLVWDIGFLILGLLLVLGGFLLQRSDAVSESG